jgi:hypothetical protein
LVCRELIQPTRGSVDGGKEPCPMHPGVDAFGDISGPPLSPREGNTRLFRDLRGVIVRGRITNPHKEEGLRGGASWSEHPDKTNPPNSIRI